MNYRSYEETAEETRGAIDCLCRYLEAGERTPLHNRAMYRALQVLNVKRRRSGWSQSPKWRYRLELAGIDPVTREVVDRRRWARCWAMVSKTWKFYQSEAIRGNALDSDAPWPPEGIVHGPRLNRKGSRWNRGGTVREEVHRSECAQGVEPEGEKPDALSKFRAKVRYLE